MRSRLAGRMEAYPDVLARPDRVVHVRVEHLRCAVHRRGVSCHLESMWEGEMRSTSSSSCVRRDAFQSSVGRKTSVVALPKSQSFTNPHESNRRFSIYKNRSSIGYSPTLMSRCVMGGFCSCICRTAAHAAKKIFSTCSGLSTCFCNTSTTGPPECGIFNARQAMGKHTRAQLGQQEELRPAVPALLRTHLRGLHIADDRGMAGQLQDEYQHVRGERAEYHS